MRLSSESIVNIHRDWIELLQASESVEKHHDSATTFYSLDGSTEDIRCDTLEVLQDAHAKGLTQDLVRVFIVAIPDVFWAHE